MDAPLLLDTCAAIWMAQDDKLSPAAMAAIEQTFERREPLYISPITAWEIGLLATRGRFKSILTPRQWLRRLLEAPQVGVAALSPEILLESNLLPGKPPRDPADRIIAATARELGYAVVTRDHLLLDYAADGHLRAIAC